MDVINFRLFYMYGKQLRRSKISGKDDTNITKARLFKYIENFTTTN